MNNYLPSTGQINRFSELEKLVENLNGAGVGYTIIGGYGLDGLYGKLTRDHGDIDLLVGDSGKAADIILQMGYSENFSNPDKTKRIFKKETLPADWKIEFSTLENLKSLTSEDIKIFVPDEPNAHLNGLTFKTPTLEGQKSIMNILTKNAVEKGWGAYKHKDHYENLIKILEN